MKLIILDRDGVINHDSPAYIKSAAEWRPIPGSLEAIASLNRAGYRVVIASNQSGIARGLYDFETLHAMHRKLDALLAPLHGRVDAVFFCPHGPQDNCDCRKPKPGLFHQIARSMHVNIGEALAVGDSLRDIQAALAAGAQPVLVRTGKGEETLQSGLLPRGIPVFQDLAAFAAHLTASGR
jgi:D-glycero-D-manno-heptose 1,7-bisphosphate phosphatase